MARGGDGAGPVMSPASDTNVCVITRPSDDYAQITQVSFIHRQWTNLWRQGPDPHQITWVWLSTDSGQTCGLSPRAATSRIHQWRPAAPAYYLRYNTYSVGPANSRTHAWCQPKSARLVPIKERPRRSQEISVSVTGRAVRHPTQIALRANERASRRSPGYRVGHAWR